MKILVTGANGFIAREIIAKLFMSNHKIVACFHNRLLKNLAYSHSFKVDFSQASAPEYWLAHLKDKDIDVVINCVGVFQTAKEKTMWNIHYETPKALFDACAKSKVKKIVHISALGIDKIKIPYTTSKLAIEEYIQSLEIASTIIRPGLVYGKGSYGGTSLFRGLASLPFIIPLPGHARQLQQPIHVDDLTKIVEKVLTLSGKQLLCAVGAEKLTIKSVLIKLRNWLGFKQAYPLSMPNSVIQIGAKLGNFILNSPISETGIKMLSVNNIATDAQEKTLHDTIHFKPRSFTKGLAGMVSSVQDRWHARLYFLKPLLRLSIAFIWIFSGSISLISRTLPISTEIMTQSHIPSSFQLLILHLFSGVDILLGLATLFNFRLQITGTLQCFFILVYTIFVSLLLPEYWLHPLAPIAKNIPLVISILIMMVLESNR